MLLLVGTCDVYQLNCISKMNFQIMCIFCCLTCTDRKLWLSCSLHVTSTIMSISNFYGESSYQTANTILKSSGKF